MSLISLAAIPMQTILPAAEAVAGNAVSVARPLLGVSALLALMMVFKPMLRGLARAGLLAIAPRLSLEERYARSRAIGASMLHRMANAVDECQPSQAAELRALASKA